MAGYDWILRHGNIHDQPQRPSLTACRICDRVFMNTPALIDHIESHMAEDHVGAATARSLMNLLPYQPHRGSLLSPFQLTPSSSQPLPVSRSYSFNSFQNPSRFNLGLSPTSVTKRPGNVAARAPFYLMGKKFTAKGPHGRYILEGEDHGVMETRWEDCTRPFLQQLDKPISSAFESKRMGDDNSHNSGDSDLRLKL